MFSRAMDPASTEAAFQSSDIPPAEVTFSWNGAGDVLTIDPDGDLAYATGTDAGAVTANQYTFTLEASATDSEGVALAMPVTSSFFTLREITETFGTEQSLTGNVRSDGSPGAACSNQDI